MLNGLDLFSGIGGIGMALAPWVRPVAYCEIDRYAQAVLLSHQSRGSLHPAPIWDDVRTLSGVFLPRIDIIYGGFPCQDISVAGRGAGLEGERSGLVHEIFRLVGETKPSFVFLENVPAIRTRGSERVVKELAALGYDCRWDVLSAFDVGAPHKRERFFLLAHATKPLANSSGGRCGKSGEREMELTRRTEAIGSSDSLADATSICKREQTDKADAKPASRKTRDESIDGGQSLADAEGERRDERRTECLLWPRQSATTGACSPFEPRWWAVEPDVGRVAHGVPLRVDRLRGLGNAVVPLQAREAFERLMGLKAINDAV